MRDKDLISLEEAYQTVQEGKFKSMAAAAALLANAHGASPLTADDHADRANPHSVVDNIVSSHKVETTPKEGESKWRKAHNALALAISKKGLKVEDHVLRDIAGDKETAERYGLYLLQKGHPIPDIIKNASKKEIGREEAAFGSSIKN